LNFFRRIWHFPPSSIEMGLRRSQDTPSLLPMVLYKYGFITAQELGQIFDLLETA
jgi:hypothetical protein